MNPAVVAIGWLVVLGLTLGIFGLAVGGAP